MCAKSLLVFWLAGNWISSNYYCVSLSQFANVSVPGPPMQTSVPSPPPRMQSSPPMPLIVSLPAPSRIRSLPLAPVIVPEQKMVLWCLVGFPHFSPQSTQRTRRLKKVFLCGLRDLRGKRGFTPLNPEEPKNFLHPRLFRVCLVEQIS